MEVYLPLVGELPPWLVVLQELVPEDRILLGLAPGNQIPQGQAPGIPAADIPVLAQVHFPSFS